MSVEEDSQGKRRWKAPADSRPQPGGRTMAKKEKVRKKTLGKSSREWVDRQLHDPYVIRAREAGYRARAAYKLLEIDEKFHVLKRGSRIIDLGCAPGGWLQVAFEKGAARIAGVDLLPVEPVGEAVIFLGDIAEPGMTTKLINALGEKPTLVLSDMAANTALLPAPPFMSPSRISATPRTLPISWGATSTRRSFRAGRKASCSNY